MAGLIRELTRLGLSSSNISSPHPPARILKVYTLTEFSHICNSDALNTHRSLKVACLKMAPTMGMVGRTYISRTGAEPLIVGVQLVSQPPVLSSQQRIKQFCIMVYSLYILMSFYSAL